MAFLPGLKKQINKVSTWAASGKMDLNIFLPGKSVYERKNQWSGRNKARRWFPQVRRGKNPWSVVRLIIIIWILQHGKEDGSVQRVGRWLADQNKRVPSGDDSMKNMLLCCVCYFYWLDHFQPNPTVRAKMAAVKVVFLFKLNLLPFYIYKKSIWLTFPPSTVHSK